MQARAANESAAGEVGSHASVCGLVAISDSRSSTHAGSNAWYRSVFRGNSERSGHPTIRTTTASVTRGLQFIPTPLAQVAACRMPHAARIRSTVVVLPFRVRVRRRAADPRCRSRYLEGGKANRVGRPQSDQGQTGSGSGSGMFASRGDISQTTSGGEDEHDATEPRQQTCTAHKPSDAGRDMARVSVCTAADGSCRCR